MFTTRIARRASFVAVATVSAAMLSSTVAPVAAFAVVVPKAPVVLPAVLDPTPAYQPQTFCDPVDKPGVTAFGRLLTSTYHDTSVVSISRSCTSESGTSEHKDGRALDWGASISNPAQVKEVQAVFAWLFAKDPVTGAPNAMVRRLGIMYIIWNKKIWGGWSQSWQPYSCSGVTACHQDHVHFSFDWAGALKKTSFWTGRVAPYVAPPTYVYTSTRFAQVVRVSAKTASVTTPFDLKRGLTYRLSVSGSYRYGAAKTALADAECSTSNGTTWKALAAGDASSMTGLLDLWVERHRAWLPLSATGGGCSAKAHTYTRVLTFPTTAPVHLMLDDPTRSDDSGTLTVTIQRV